MTAENGVEVYVSIHAPVWGATERAEKIWGFVYVSIHAPVWGATIPQTDDCQMLGFQSTLPYGERPRCQEKENRIDSCFNPRSRMGSDSPPFKTGMETVGFNPRSRMGSDVYLTSALRL